MSRHSDYPTKEPFPLRRWNSCVRAQERTHSPGTWLDAEGPGLVPFHPWKFQAPQDGPVTVETSRRSRCGRRNGDEQRPLQSTWFSLNVPGTLHSECYVRILEIYTTYGKGDLYAPVGKKKKKRICLSTPRSWGIRREGDNSEHIWLREREEGRGLLWCPGARAWERKVVVRGHRLHFRLLHERGSIG